MLGQKYCLLEKGGSMAHWVTLVIDFNLVKPFPVNCVIMLIGGIGNRGEETKKSQLIQSEFLVK